MVASLIKSREKTKIAFKVAGKALLKTAPSLLAVLGIVGLTLGVLTPETIGRLVAFPLAGSLLRSGATVMTISTFITTLVMVGIVTAPLEMKILGKKFTLLRNGLGFLAALLIAGVFVLLAFINPVAAERSTKADRH